MKGKLQRLKVGVQRSENDRRMNAVIRPTRSHVGLRTVDMPHIDSAPPGARIIEARGRYCVALALKGVFIGLFVKGENKT